MKRHFECFPNVKNFLFFSTWLKGKLIASNFECLERNKPLSPSGVYFFYGVLKMNFPLQYLESYLDEASLLAGEQLLEEEGVHDLQEVSRNFYIAKVRDGKIYEVEAKISPSKVTATTCDCNRFQEEKQCGHIAAVLMVLRQHVVQTLAARAPEAAGEETPRRLTTGAVLDQVNHDDLVAFIKQYAKTNRNFALALKARFAPNVSNIDSREKYLQLLDSTIAAARRPDRTFNQRGANSIYKMLLEIHHQIEDALTLRYLAEAVVMAQSIIEKIAPLLRKLQALEQEIRQQVLEAFEVLEMVLELSPPLDLRESIWAYCLRECPKLLYRNVQLDQYFLRVLIEMAAEEEEVEQLLDLLDRQIHRYFFEKRELAKILLAKLSLLEKLGRVEDVQNFVNENITNEEVLLFAVRQSLSKGNYSRVKMLANIGLERSENKDTIALLEETLLKIALSEQDLASIAHFGKRRLLQTFDFEYYKMLRERLAHDWTAYFPEVLETLRLLPSFKEKMRLLAAIYYEEGFLKELFTYLYETQSLDLVQEFGHLLLPYDREGVYHLYNNLFQHYLNYHIGRKPSEKIRAIIHRLYESGAAEIADALVENLRANFSERHTLMEELELL